MSQTVLNIFQNICNVNDHNFDAVAISLFHYQYYNNPIYKSFVDAIRVNPASVNTIADIPFLPISFFKTHQVVSGNSVTSPALVFESSGTTGEVPSKHFVLDAQIYEQSLLDGFEQYYGSVQDYTFLALLPSYLERKNASLVHMMQTLMAKSQKPNNGFYLNDWEQLAKVIQRLRANGEKMILVGVTFALIDFAEAYPMDLSGAIIMETGGMKGRKKEWTRLEVHSFLKEKWQLHNVHSEYGMTELLSQAYASENGLFHPTKTMKVLCRDINDPLTTSNYGSGCLNIIDLANRDSCAFIATEDLGKVNADGTFEVLGRMDHSALRGCSLMTA